MKRPYFRIPDSHLLNIAKQTSGPLLTFYGSSDGLLCFLKILHRQVDKCNTVTKT
jgi:hypothetical protein